MAAFSGPKCTTRALNKLIQNVDSKAGIFLF